ncbi:MAG: hypothetical protein RLZZ455_879 [Candidatus Parcubacteria bacterium]|jgi:hypothetical protein
MALLEKNKNFTIMQGMTECLETGHGGVSIRIQKDQLTLEWHPGGVGGDAHVEPVESEVVFSRKERREALQRVISGIEDRKDSYACETDVKALFALHGNDLAGSMLARHGLNNEPSVDINDQFGVVLSDAEEDVIGRALRGMSRDAVPPAIVGKWAIGTGVLSGLSPEDARMRGALALQGVAHIATQRNFEVAENLEDRENPFLVMSSPTAPMAQ